MQPPVSSRIGSEPVAVWHFSLGGGPLRRQPQPLQLLHSSSRSRAFASAWGSPAYGSRRRRLSEKPSTDHTAAWPSASTPWERQSEPWLRYQSLRRSQCTCPGKLSSSLMVL